MSAQLSQTLKDSKLSFKSVLEHLYEKDAELVNKMITELETNKPTKKTMTQEEKDERKRVIKHKNAHIKKFIEDMGGETRVTETQIKEEKKKYDAKRRESKKVKADESNASNAKRRESKKVKADESNASNEEPTKAPVKASVESKESDDDSDPFELEEEPVSDVEEQEPPKVTPKKTKKEKIPNAPKKASKKDKSPKRTTDTDSDQE